MCHPTPLPEGKGRIRARTPFASSRMVCTPLRGQSHGRMPRGPGNEMRAGGFIPAAPIGLLLRRSSHPPHHQSAFRNCRGVSRGVLLRFEDTLSENFGLPCDCFDDVIEIRRYVLGSFYLAVIASSSFVRISSSREGCPNSHLVFIRMGTIVNWMFSLL